MLKKCKKKCILAASIMNKISVFLYLLGFAFLGFKVSAQNISNKGKEFWVGYGHHQFMTFPTDNSMNMTIYLSAEEAATVTIEVDSSGLLPSQWWRRTYNIPANTVIDIANPATPAASFTAAALAWGPIPKGAVNAAASNTSINYDFRLVNDPPPANNGGEGIFRKKGIHIISNVPIVAYAHIYGSVSSGATMLLPIESWGYAYTSINSRQADANNSYNWMYVISRVNNTVVEITPSQPSQLGKPAGVPFQVTLNKGQIYQLQGQANAAGDGVDLTGTTVKVIANPSGSCHPIAVFSGSSRTSNPACGSGSSRDNDMQQAFPQQTWGKRYLLAPLSNANSSTNLQPNVFQTNPYKVVVREANTVVRRNGVIMTGLVANSYYYFESNQAELIEADKPIMVAQYMSANCIPGTLGDPEMIYWSPIEQGIKQTGFYRNTKESINANFVTIVAKTNAVGSLRIDNSATFSHQYVHPRDNRYTVVIKGWAAAQAQSIITCDSPFVAVTYGLGGAESYGYNAGTYLNNLNAVCDYFNIPDTTSTIKAHPFGFTNTPMQIGALIRYKPTRIWWKLSALGGVISPNADVIENTPVPVDSVLDNGLFNYRYRLPGSYKFNAPGTYYIPIQITSNVYGADDCRNIEDISLEYIIKPIPTADFTHMVGACSSDSVKFFGPTTTAEGYKVLKWKWTFSAAPGDTSILQNPKAKLVTGNNNVKLELVVEVGGLASTTKTVNVPGAVDVKWGASSYNICVGQTVTFTDTTNTAAAITNYHWNFGDGGPSAIVNTASNSNQTYTFNTVGSFTVKHTVTVPTATCPIDTVPRVINVAAKAYVDFNVSPNCQPANGATTFTANIPPGVAATGYAWTFGDPGSGALNTGSGASANHNYSADGSYPVKLAITTVSGCNGDSTKNITITRKPQIDGKITISNGTDSLCDNTPIRTINLPTISNGVTGTYLLRSFKGGITDPSTPSYNPALASYGTDTIYYKFTTTNSCVDSTKYPITVYARPRGNFSYIPTNTTCIADTTKVRFSPNFSVPSSSIKSYAWSLESPSTAPSTLSNLPNPAYNYAEGNYLANVIVSGNNGCSFDTAMNIAITKAPNIPALRAIDTCETVSPFTIAAPLTAGGTGSFRSFKNAITAAGLYTPATAGYGVDTVYFRFTTTGNCTDSVKVPITIKARPRGNFTFSPSGCLDASGVVTFTNNENIPGSTILNRLWQFESPSMAAGNISTGNNPNHVYNAGTYTIKLSWNGANGCSFDTAQTVTFGRKPAPMPLSISNVCESAAPFTLASNGSGNGVNGVGSWRSFKNAVTGDSTYNPAIAGFGVDTIYYRITTGVDCYDTVKQAITINARPRGNFDFSPKGCLPVNGAVSFTPNFNVQNSTVGGYLWRFDNVNNPSLTSTNSMPTNNYTTDGTYTVLLTVTGANTCTFDTSLTTAFNRIPNLGVLTTPATPVCENGSSFQMDSAARYNSVLGKGVFSSFKNAISPTGLYTPATAGYGVDTIYYTVTSPGGCATTVKTPITINARPRASFSFTPNGCLDASGTVSFLSSDTVPNSSVISRLWKFEDPDASLAKTSTLKNPFYNYNSGTYTIRLTVNGANGCSFDTLQTQTFNKTPALSNLRRIDTCENVASFTIVAPSITNGVTGGTGVFSSFKGAISSAGLYNPATAGAGVDTIYYTYTANGCSDSKKVVITIYPKPSSTFTVQSDVCLDSLARFAFTGNNPSITITNWQWLYGDGNTNNFSNGNPFTKNYASIGGYDAKLVTTSSFGCISDTGRQSLTIRPMPVAAFTVPVTVCMPNGTATFTNNSSVNPTSTLSYSWNFGDAANSTVSNPNTSTATDGVHTYTNVANYTVSLRVESAFGCVKNESKNLAALAPLVQKPRAFIKLTDDTLCRAISGSFIDSSWSTGRGIKDYNWFFGDGGTSTTPSPNYTYISTGDYTVKLLVTDSVGCVSDTFSRTINVAPKAFVDFTVSPNCKPANGFTQFTTNIPNATGYSWNFGDPISGVNNTSSLPSPPHFYNKDSTYPVRLTITVPTGCNGDTTKNIVINRTPSLTGSIAIPTSPVCENGAIFPIASFPVVSNGVIANYSFSSFKNAISTTGNYTPALAGAGVDTIYITYTSDSGCIASSKQAITIHPKPNASFAVQSDVCLDSVARFVYNASNPAITITNWQWFYGNGNTDNFTNGNSFTKTYNNTGAYVAKLVTVSNFGCNSDTARQNITIRPMPVAAFTVPSVVCMPNGITQFTNASSVTPNGTLSYNWDFGDPIGSTMANPNTSTGTNPSHIYPSISNYTVSLRVESAFGCVKNEVKTINPFVQKPNAVIKVNKDTLCQGNTSMFIDSSWSPSGAAIGNHRWSFGDGGTSGMTNPNYTYTNPGNYTVRLVVSAGGCDSDTFPKNVLVYLQPVIDAGPSFVVQEGTSVQFNPTANDSTTTKFLWTPAMDFTKPDTLRAFLDRGVVALSGSATSVTKIYRLTATGLGQCTATDTLTVKILGQLKIPNAFSPNGDGINDTWDIPNLVDYPGATVQIFNRNGQSVYLSNGYNRAWDGKYLGNVLPSGTYYYIINPRNGYSVISGSVTILR